MDEVTWKNISKADKFKAPIDIPQPSHPPVRDDILNFYNDKLKELTGFDYWKSRQIYIDMNNMPGVYPDVCLMFYFLLKEYKPKKIVEFGSGFSTLVFNYLITKLELDTMFRSYEQNEKYLHETSELLDRFKKLNKMEFYSSGSKIELAYMFPEEEQFANIIKQADFVFIDWHYRSWLLTKKADWFTNCDIVILDDSTSPGYSIGTLYEFMNKSNRYSFTMYNGGGRTDMVEFISYKEELDPNVAYYLNQTMGYL